VTAIYLLNPSFLFSAGLMSGVLILSHAVMGSGFMGAEFTGILRFNGIEGEASLLRSPALILGLFFLYGAARMNKVLNKRKEQPTT